jgi:hypothetical protein
MHGHCPTELARPDGAGDGGTADGTRRHPENPLGAGGLAGEVAAGVLSSNARRGRHSAKRTHCHSRLRRDGDVHIERRRRWHRHAGACGLQAVQFVEAAVKTPFNRGLVAQQPVERADLGDQTGSEGDHTAPRVCLRAR